MPRTAAPAHTSVAIDLNDRERTKYASAVATPATSADTPNTPKTLAACAIGSTVAWL